MSQIITIGLDIAKSVFQVHGVDAAGTPVLRKQLRRGELLRFFERQPPAWSASRPAGRRITGRGS